MISPGHKDHVHLPNILPMSNFKAIRLKWDITKTLELVLVLQAL